MMSEKEEEWIQRARQVRSKMYKPYKKLERRSDGQLVQLHFRHKSEDRIKKPKSSFMNFRKDREEFILNELSNNPKYAHLKTENRKKRMHALNIIASQIWNEMDKESKLKYTQEFDRMMQEYHEKKKYFERFKQLKSKVKHLLKDGINDEVCDLIVRRAMERNVQIPKKTSRFIYFRSKYGQIFAKENPDMNAAELSYLISKRYHEMNDEEKKALMLECMEKDRLYLEQQREFVSNIMKIHKEIEEELFPNTY